MEDSGEDDAPEPAHEGARTDEYHEDEGESEIDGVEHEPAVDEGKEESRPAPSSGRKTDTEAYKDDQEYVILPPVPALFLEERRHHFEYVAHPLVA